MRIYDIITTFYIAEVKNMTPVSICIIAKNEEKNMDKFLSSIQKSMKNYPHEIVIVDTGSSDSTLEIIQKTVAKGKKVTLVGFGTFESRKRAARTGRNPQTGAELKIAAKTVPAFSAGKKFKELVK